MAIFYMTTGKPGRELAIECEVACASEEGVSRTLCGQNQHLAFLQCASFVGGIIPFPMNVPLPFRADSCCRTRQNVPTPAPMTHFYYDDLNGHRQGPVAVHNDRCHTCNDGVYIGDCPCLCGRGSHMVPLGNHECPALDSHTPDPVAEEKINIFNLKKRNGTPELKPSRQEDERTRRILQGFQNAGNPNVIP